MQRSKNALKGVLSAFIYTIHVKKKNPFKVVLLISVSFHCLYLFGLRLWVALSFLTYYSNYLSFSSSLLSNAPLSCFFLFSSANFGHSSFIYEEVTTVAESVIPSIMYFSSCFSHSPLTLKVHFSYCCFLIFHVFLFTFCFHSLPFLYEVFFLDLCSFSHLPLKWAFRLNSKVSNFEWLLIENGQLA